MIFINKDPIMKYAATINPGIRFRTVSNPFGYSPSGAFIPKLNLSNFFIPSDALFNNRFTYEINKSSSLSFKNNEKIKKGFDGLF